MTEDMPIEANKESEATDQPGVEELLAQRERLNEWLSKLESVDADVPERVVLRVRADYEERLRSVVQALREYEGALRQRLEKLREELRASAARREEAQERLEEARLRHQIGELTEAEWQARREELNRIGDEAVDAEAEARVEFERLESLIAQMDSETREMDISPGDTTLVPETLPLMGGSEPPAKAGEPTFLREVDRTLSAANGPPPEALIPDPEALIPDPETRPAPGVKCPECGYTNDSSAFFCGVCGIDLS